MSTSRKHIPPQAAQARIPALLAIAMGLIVLVAACAQPSGGDSSGPDIEGCRVCRTNCPEGIAPGSYYQPDPVRACLSPFPTTLRPFTAEQFCSAVVPGRVRVVFRWLPSLDGGARSQWIDISLADNGFAEDTFVSHGPLAPWESELVLDGLLPGTRHYWRVNTLIDGLWLPSDGEALALGSC